MVSKFVLGAVALVAFALVLPTSSLPLGCNPCCATAPPLALPLPLPATIPLGNLCSCKPVHLKPTLLPGPCGCPSAVNPLLLKQLLPVLLPALLGGTC